MRVTVVYNPSAGESEYEARDLVGLLRLAGHAASAVAKGPRSITRAIRARPDVLVAAGGDGTVAKVARALHRERSPIPVAILPTGTSNNIARSLGAPDDVPGILLALAETRAVRFDIGVVRAPWGEHHFVEAAGFGFIGAMLERRTSVRGQLTRMAGSLAGRIGARRRHDVARLIQRSRPVFVRVVADSIDLSGDYLAVEVMNIRQIGPRIVLAPDAIADDGWLDLALVRAADREGLADYVDSGCVGSPPIVTRRIRRVDLTWPSRGGHVDDEPWPGKEAIESGDLACVGISGTIEVLLLRE